MKQKKPIRRMSAKKRQQIIDEVRIRVALCQRAGGVWVPISSLTGGYCSKGFCELCGEPPDWRGLHPHEEPKRSQGGRLSMEGSKMACGKCHSATEGIKEV